MTCVNATLNTSIHKIGIELPQENEMPGCLLIGDAGRLVGQPDDISCRLHLMGRKIAPGGTVESFALRCMLYTICRGYLRHSCCSSGRGFQGSDLVPKYPC